MNRRLRCRLMAAALFNWAAAGHAGAGEGYFLSLYGSQVSDTPFNAIVRGIADDRNYYLVAAAHERQGS